MSATNLEFISAKVHEKLGEPKPIAPNQDFPQFDYRVAPEDLRLPGVVSEEEWSVAEKLTIETEQDVFGGKLSPLNKALLFRTIYIELLQMSLKPN